MKVAILGATGAVGQTMLRILEERQFPVRELVPLASRHSAGRRLYWRGRDWIVQAPSDAAFAGCDVALFSAGAERSREWAAVAAARGAVVIDNSSAWRTHPKVPLVVPEVNPDAAQYRPFGIIANPNCAVIQLAVVLEALRRAAGLRRVVASTYQSVSGAGQKGIDALSAELRGGSALASPFVAPVAGNVVPQIGMIDDAGWSDEEDKIRTETRRILGLPELPVAATCVRVPVEVGHSIAATAETTRDLSPAEATAALQEMPGLELLAGPRHPLARDIAGRDTVAVGRFRRDRDLPNTFHFWVVADNLRKGAATNAVQIAGLVCEHAVEEAAR